MALDVFKLFGTVEIDNSKANNALDGLSSKGTQASGNLSKAFSAIGKGAVAVGKTIVTGLAVGGAAFAGLTAKALSAAGELEQNMGGSEAVFGKYAGKMQETAKSAFSNMGLSTSDYLATANKMGALFQGAGFSIEDSMTISQDAMQRAADVASIMGIDTTSAMEAIAGAAKGNFTMMDNLGVAMNDTTLQAYALSKGITKSTSEMTNQEKIGLAMEMFMEKTAYAAGNYAEENETLAGSLGTAKAALTNFLDGSGSVEDLVSSFGNLANVVVESLQEILPRLTTGLTEIVQKVIPMLQPLMLQMLPSIVEGAVSLINGLVSAMPSIVQALMSAVPALISGVGQLISSLVAALPEMVQILLSGIASQAPTLLSGIGDLITGIANFIQTNLPIVTDKAKEMVSGLGQKIEENLPDLISKGLDILLGLSESILKNIPTLVATGMDLVMSLVKGIVGALPELIAKAPTIISNFANTISRSMQTIFTKGLEIIWELIKGIIGAIPDLIANLPKIIQAIFDVWNAINWMNLGKNLISGIKNGITKLGGSLKTSAKNLFTNLKTTIGNIFKSIKTAITNPIQSARSLFSTAVSAIKNFAVNGFNAMKSRVSSIFTGIKNAITHPIQTAQKLISGIIDKIKGIFSGLNLKFPNIPLPHFTVSPSGWKIADLLKGSIPKLGIDWYAKAMNNPMVMTSPTIFGYNPQTGNVMGGGEAGSEVVSGTNTLMNMISSAVAGQNEAVIYYLEKLVEILADYFPQILEAAGHDIVTNDGLIVAHYAPKFNTALGKLSEREGRRK